MEGIKTFAHNLVRKKTLTQDMMKSELRKCLTLADLTFLSMGSMVGSGLYVLTGTVTRNVAGPSIVLSYLIAAVASGFSAICYAEFGARIPVTGSAYQFTYISVGEIWAFMIGWNVALEHAVSATAVAKSISSYLDSMFGHPIRAYMIAHVPMPGGEILAEYPDFIAVAILILFTIILALGVNTSSKVNMTFCFINLLIVVFIFVTGMFLADMKNWTGGKGFFPYGFSGTIGGASTLIFSYVGYEIVASSTEETLRPKRDVPLSLVISLSVVVLAYCGASASLTLMVPYDQISIASPFPDAYAKHGWAWARYIVTIGALAAMSTSLLSAMFVVPRYMYAMGRDGLLWKILTQVNVNTQVPVISVIVCGIACILFCIIFNLHALVEFIAIGQLLACTFVALCVIILRYKPNNISRYMEFTEEQQNRENSESELKTEITENKQTEKTKIKLDALRSNDKASLAKNDYGSLEDDDVTVNAQPTSSTGTSLTEFKIDETESKNVGRVRQEVLDSKIGFLFKPLNNFKPGDVPQVALLVSSLCVVIIAALVLFALQYCKQLWWILLVAILSVFVVVGVIIMEVHTQDTSIKTFKVPLLPYVPFISIVINIFLILKLKPMTWLRLAVWMAVGLIIYFAYGYKNSQERKNR